MASFNTSQSTANMMACHDVWPTNTVLLEAAKAKLPQYAEQLDDLVVLAHIGMTHKKELEDEIGTWHLVNELEYKDSEEWPTNHSTFASVVLTSEPYKKEALYRLWNLVHQGLDGKRKLDAMIVRILDGTFEAEGSIPCILAPEKPVCNPGGCSWPEFCRCGWQYDPVHEVLQFRDGTAKWDPSTETWTWTSKYTDAMIPPGTQYDKEHRMHFPYQEQEQEENQKLCPSCNYRNPSGLSRCRMCAHRPLPC